MLVCEIMIKMLNNIRELWQDFSQHTGFHGVNKLSVTPQRNKARL